MRTGLLKITLSQKSLKKVNFFLIVYIMFKISKIRIQSRKFFFYSLYLNKNKMHPTVSSVHFENHIVIILLIC